MWGVWGADPRGQDPESEPFEVQMQGMGLFSCRKSAWPGFNPNFRGFGGEEGYIHEKFRRSGRRCLCLPWLRWIHRFGRPRGVPYPVTVEAKFRNYLIGHAELGLDLVPVLEHFSPLLAKETVALVIREVLLDAELGPSGNSINIGAEPSIPEPWDELGITPFSESRFSPA
jgi:hypothetical protein